MLQDLQTSEQYNFCATNGISPRLIQEKLKENKQKSSN